MNYIFNQEIFFLQKNENTVKKFHFSTCSIVKNEILKNRGRRGGGGMRDRGGVLIATFS